MKTERRHELQTNVLASSLAHWIERLKPYSRALVAALIAVAVALGAWAYLSTEKTRRQADGWNQFFEAIGATNPNPVESLRDLSSRYSGTMVGQWARLTLGEMQLIDGTNRLMTDRARANEELREARERFQELLAEASYSTILERATFGLAQAHEAQGELESARQEYRELAEKWPDGAFAEAAQERLKALEESGTKSFYDWLARYEPAKPLSREPGTPGARPDFMSEPDEGSILNMPPLLEKSAGPALPSIIESEGKTPEGEEPASPEGEPAAEMPAPAASETPPAEPEAEPAPPAESAPPAGDSTPPAAATEPEAKPAGQESGPQLP